MFLNRLKNSPKDKYAILMVIIGLVMVLLIYLIIFIPIEFGLPTYGILDFEFAWNPDKVELILLTWGVAGITSQFIAICWDFLFIVGYVSLSFGLITLVLRKSEGKLQSIGLYFALTPFLTGILDVIENTNLLTMLGTPTSISAINSFMASFCALFKFIFLFAAIAYFLVGLVVLIIKRIKK